MDETRASLGELSDAEAILILSQLVDLATDTDNQTLVDQVLVLADELEARCPASGHLVVLDYIRANAWGCRYQRRYRERDNLWDFEQPEILQQVLLLRRAAYGAGFPTLHPFQRCQILTNLGNQLDALGRFVEARACWSEALATSPEFWMARANRGRGLMYYAEALHDPGHKVVFAHNAHKDLILSLRLIKEYPEFGDPRLYDAFASSAERIDSDFDLAAIDAHYSPDMGYMGNGSDEQDYRRWCLANTLFLNPLNDVEQAPIAARDALTLPDFILPVSEPPVAAGMFNELKQLYVSARLMLWEGCHAVAGHFSDRDVVLYDTLDSPAYGLGIEKTKASFRMAYSIFDKIAYFLDHYLILGMEKHKISFRTVWREKKIGPLRPSIAHSENWPLRGLYWLSKDLFEKGVMDSADPQARALAELRNHLEHKYVKVHDDATSISEGFDPFLDTLAYHITKEDLERKTLRLLQLSRSALIYLSLAMHHEERRREDHLDGYCAPMQLNPLGEA